MEEARKLNKPFITDVGVEASEYFSKTKNESAFASNRFGATKTAAKWAEKIKELGCEKLLVTGLFAEADRQKSEGDVYADTFFIFKPSEACMEYLKKCRKDEFDEEAPGIFRIWWD